MSKLERFVVRRDSGACNGGRWLVFDRLRNEMHSTWLVRSKARKEMHRLNSELQDHVVAA